MAGRRHPGPMRPTPSRRRFLHDATLAGSAAAFGCAPGSPDKAPSDDGGDDTGAAASDDTGTPDTGPAPCDELLEGGVLVDAIPFVGEDPRTLETLTGEGLDGRHVMDLSTLESDQLVVSNARFFVRTAWPDGIDPDAEWAVRLFDGGGAETTLSIGELFARSADAGVVHFECSGNTSYGGFGLQGAARWAGVPLLALLDELGLDDPDAWVRVSGNDDHTSTSSNSRLGASWVFSREQLEQAGAFIALEMNGEPLPLDHGFPVRLVVPGWYGCTCIKWLERIELVDADADSTDHMREFASRTHQSGEPALARDFRPARADLSAAPARAEHWSTVDGEDVLLLVGVLWGGIAHGTDHDAALEVRVGAGDWAPVTVCPVREDARTWALWRHVLSLPESGEHRVQLRVAADVPATRLDAGWYERTVRVP
jgi:DMSO/TMAO reductase YedYZ molybdopterin-dependent catalytic subunit